MQLKESDMDSLGYLVTKAAVESDQDLNFLEKYINLFSSMNICNGAMTKLLGDASVPTNIDFTPLSSLLYLKP